MRKCPNCDELIPYNLYCCPECRSTDFGWRENIISNNSKAKYRYNRKLRYDREISIQSNAYIPRVYEIRLSAFADSGELGFHLERIKQLYKKCQDEIEVKCCASSWMYEWDYGADFEQDNVDFNPDKDVYLPPSLPLLALVEVSRFLRSLIEIDNKRLKVTLTLPSKDHAATRFIESTQLFHSISGLKIMYTGSCDITTFQPGCDDVLVPLTYIGKDTSGQLSTTFHNNFNQLAKAGHVHHEWRTDLRNVIMEAAANADIWGEGGWVSCFLRQEKRGAKGFGHQSMNFDPARETHLFIDIFTLGPTLSKTLNMETEREAAQAVSLGSSARTTGGGRGLPFIMNSIIKKAVGTVFISSGSYTRIATPDGLIREYQSGGADYLPGVHICAIVPLAIVTTSKALNQIGQIDE